MFITVFVSLYIFLFNLKIFKNFHHFIIFPTTVARTSLILLSIVFYLYIFLIFFLIYVFILGYVFITI